MIDNINDLQDGSPTLEKVEETVPSGNWTLEQLGQYAKRHEETAKRKMAIHTYREGHALTIAFVKVQKNWAMGIGVNTWNSTESPRPAMTGPENYTPSWIMKRPFRGCTSPRRITPLELKSRKHRRRRGRRGRRKHNPRVANPRGRLTWTTIRMGIVQTKALNWMSRLNLIPALTATMTATTALTATTTATTTC